MVEADVEVEMGAEGVDGAGETEKGRNCSVATQASVKTRAPRSTACE